MRRLIIGSAVAAALLAGTALAEKTLYIKTKDAKVLEKADARAKLVKTLQPGDEVTWKGADKKNKLFHEISTADSKGYTLQQNLSPSKPSLEVVSSDGKTIDAEALKSSGAATKALSEAGLKYAEQNSDTLALTKGVMTGEGVAATVDSQQASEFGQKQTGGGK